MKTRLIIDGNAVYEIDEECEACQQRSQRNQKNQKKQENRGEWCGRSSLHGENPGSAPDTGKTKK